MDALLVEMGVLLPPSDPEFEAYNVAWDKEYGYYDELQCYTRMQHKDRTIEFAREYVKEGVEGTYAIIATTMLNEDSVDRSLESVEPDALILDMDVEGETYDVESVIFSACKRDGKLVYGFVKQSPHCKMIKPEHK